MHLFFHSNPEVDAQLSEEESLHATKVLRLKENDTIVLLDGNGGLYDAKITSNKSKKCSFEITRKELFKQVRDYKLHVAIAPTKNMDRIEWFVEKAIEVGIDEISFIQCERSERKNINMERIHKIAISAMKQSMNTYLPKINPLQKFSEFLIPIDPKSSFIAHLEDGERKLLKEVILGMPLVTVLIGPEGDFSRNEIAQATKLSIKPVSLGNSRLRTETAGLSACFISATLLT